MGLKNMINNYFYGKQGQGDFTLENLPQNRRQLFFEVLKVRWSSMVGVNLLYMVAWIPAIVWTFIVFSAIMGMLSADEAAFSREDLLTTLNTWLMWLAPCIAITGPFNAGVTYVLRNWARDEHSFVLSDFKDALKDNWKQALPVSVVSGVLPFLMAVGWQFYSGMLANSMIFILPIALLFLVGFIWTLSSPVMYPMMITYRLKLRDVIRNSILLTLAKLPFSVLVKLLTLVIPALALGLALLIPSIQMYVLLITVLLYILFLVAFHKLITVSYANWLCETYLNPRIEGARTNIGLRPEDWDDVTYIPEDDEE